MDEHVCIRRKKFSDNQNYFLHTRLERVLSSITYSRRIFLYSFLACKLIFSTLLD